MKKTLTARGKQIEVEDLDQTNSSGVPAKLLRATVGSTSVEFVHTFGAEDGPRPALSAAQVQTDLDDARQKIAAEAAWRDELQGLLSQIS